MESGRLSRCNLLIVQASGYRLQAAAEPQSTWRTEPEGLAWRTGPEDLKHPEPLTDLRK